VYVTFGSAVARTAAESVICGTGVGRSVGAAVARAVGAGVGVVTRAARPLAVGVGLGVVGTGLGVGGGVGASVRNGNGDGDPSGSGSGSATTGFSATGGLSGAFGFFGWASAYVVEPTIERPVTTIAARRSAQAGIYAVIAGIRSKRVARTSFASTFMCVSRISW